MPKIIGLTGGIASGKSTVSCIWKSRNVVIIDADQIARDIVRPGQPAYWLIKQHFGASILNTDRTVDRKQLGRIIFQSRGERQALNRRTHPFIILTMLSKLFFAVFIKWESIIALDTPLLFETGNLIPFCSSIVVVACEPHQQLERLIARDEHRGISEEEAKRRIDSQIPLSEKKKLATYVIDNSGSREQLEEQTTDVLARLQPSPLSETLWRSAALFVTGNILLRLLYNR